ncbi:MAG: hypothetical protein HW405_89 [Candidatus Berkelbacteria bacterium]|nr:hypothetical protein [Candidatus Berkelbacteria bacterium]
MKFAKEMLKIKDKLEDLGHRVITPENMHKPVSRGTHGENAFIKIKHGLIKLHYQKIKKSDAILAANFSNKIPNYIGGSAFIEMAFAHVLNKKIFLLNPIPQVSYEDEIIAMSPIIINGDLSKIK